MKIHKFTDPDYPQLLSQLNRRYRPDPQVESTVRQIIAEVASEGDPALLRYTAKFNGPQLTPEQIKVSDEEIQNSFATLPPSVREALEAARANVQAFARQTLRQTWQTTNAQGVIVGERFQPLRRVGIYIPGGTAPLVSSAIMSVAIAQAVGVSEIVAATPAQPDASVAPALLAALHLSGATEVLRLGGAQAIAALALGTQSIRPVQKIFGPGSPWVVEAKRQLFGTVAIDLLPGPSEVLVIADNSANPEWVAADLLAQAEHGHGSIAILLTPSEKTLAAVESAALSQLPKLPRAAELASALANSHLVLVSSMDEAIQIANNFAPEHVSIATSNPHLIADQLHSAGAIFLGHATPVALGDFLAGPSHVLPTGGAAKSFAGLTADQFLARSSFVQCELDTLKKSDPYIQIFSQIEGLAAHGRSSSIRIES